MFDAPHECFDNKRKQPNTWRRLIEISLEKDKDFLPCKVYPKWLEINRLDRHGLLCMHEDEVG